MRSGALALPTKTNAVLGTTTVAVLLCYLVFRSVTAAKLKRKNDSSRDDVQVVCDGLVDLIRDQDCSYTRGKLLLEQPLPGMTREELAKGRLVIVVCGPSSTKVYQSYVVNKLMRYLRWSNLVRKHFQSSDQESSRRRDAGNNNSDAETRENGRPPPMMDRTEIFHDSDSVAGNGPTRACVGIDGDGGGGVVTMNAGGDSGRPRRRRSDIGSSSTVAYGHASGVNGGDGGGCRHVEGAVSNGFVVSPHRNGCDGGGSGSGDGGGGGGQGDEGLSERYTFSDRGKAAALTTIAVQESAKAVASWLGRLEGGVAVIEAGGSGWASTRQGRDALPRFLKAATGPDVGLLWVELLPAGLSQQHQRVDPDSRGGGGGGEPGRRTQRPQRSSSSSQWKSYNGLPSMVTTPGGRVVNEFLHSGNLMGAGGHVLYESVRGGCRSSSSLSSSRGDERGAAGGNCSSGGGDKDFYFVSLADQGMDVRSRLEHSGYPLVGRVGTFVGALKMKKSWNGCPVFLTRHGEAIMNQMGSMGGDTNLSEEGNRYASVLADFVAAQADAGQSRLSVWCSPMKRAVQTARAVKCRRYMEWQPLRELDTGAFNGFSYKQVGRDYPEEFAAREEDKLAYRYPQGESYLDVVNRLDPVIVALEREEEPIVIISHQAVLRCLYAYFLDVPLRHMPRLPIPMHTVVKLTPSDDIAQDHRAARWKEHRYQLMRPSAFEQLAVAVVTGKGSYAETSQLGESLS